MKTSLETLIGARLVVGLPGPEVTAVWLRSLEELHVQHLILFKRNLINPEQVVRLIHDIEEALGHPLVVMIDHEGGRVVRFPRGFKGITFFPAAALLGAQSSVEQIEQQGRIEARELLRLGIRVNLAPCIDVRIENSDSVIGDRSYGSDPHQVATLATARIRGMQSQGLMACAKHFPGLGAVGLDPHQQLPTIELDGHEMDETHLVPFRSAIDAEVAMVMSSHVCFPRWKDPPGLPATFSARLIRGKLRQELGFPGLILTDDLDMGALREFGSLGDVLVRATEAGHDLLLVCGADLARLHAAVEALKQAYRIKYLSCDELESTFMRVDKLRRFIFYGEGKSTVERGFSV